MSADLTFSTCQKARSSLSFFHVDILGFRHKYYLVRFREKIVVWIKVNGCLFETKQMSVCVLRSQTFYNSFHTLI